MIKRITIVFLLFQNTLIYSQLSKKDVNKTYNVALQEQCEKKQGKWHKNKCWKAITLVNPPTRIRYPSIRITTTIF